ncbi:MAG: DUF6576 domain-containing protein [Flavobacteriales bacterium]
MIQNIIQWFKSFFKPNSKKSLFDDPPSDDYEYNQLVAKREIELDRILAKIQKHGIETLTREEKRFLKQMKN